MVMRKGENLSLDGLKEKMATDIEFCREGWNVSGRVPCGKLDTPEDRRCVLAWNGFPLHKTTSNHLMWEAMKDIDSRIEIIKLKDNMMFA